MTVYTNKNSKSFDEKFCQSGIQICEPVANEIGLANVYIAPLTLPCYLAPSSQLGPPPRFNQYVAIG
jgi:hypothetical protein